MLIAKLQTKVTTSFFYNAEMRGISFQGKKKQHLSGYKLISDNELW